MFDNISGKIKKLASVLFWVGIGVSFVLFIVTIADGSDISAIIGLIYLAIGSALSYANSLLVYGFGQLVENSNKNTESKLKQQVQTQQQQVSMEEIDIYAEETEKYKNPSGGSVLDELKNINTFNSTEEMVVAFNNQRQNTIYEDEHFVITESFFAIIDKKTLFILDGILDVKPIVYKVNGIIDHVSLSIMYYDGEKHDFKFRRPLGISNMQEKVNKIGYVANIISLNSKNFRKYPNYRI